MSDQPINIGIIGCGNIFKQYAAHIPPYPFLKIAACADLDVERARKAAAEHDIPKGCSVDDLLADPDIDIVINLTVPVAHAPVNLQILEAGKHPYTEKPFAVDVPEGRAVLDKAREKGLLVGCAPDTVLGGGAQTVRGALEAGRIGTPRSVEIRRTSCGPFHEHPNPGFFLGQASGPLYDVGPYDLSGIVNFFGPIETVSAMAQKRGETYTVTEGPAKGETYPVDTYTHVATNLRTKSGVMVSMLHSFDCPAFDVAFNIHGEKASLKAPDLNRFDGDVTVLDLYAEEWETLPHTHNTKVGRGIGVADLARAIRTGRPHRASGALGLHVLDVMETIFKAADTGQTLTVKSTMDQPAVLTPGLAVGEMD